MRFVSSLLGVKHVLDEAGYKSCPFELLEAAVEESTGGTRGSEMYYVS